VSQDINVLALVKGAERYIFLYDDSNRAETLRTLGRYASDPELSFTWYDAAVLSQKIRQQTRSAEQTTRRFHTPQPSDLWDPDELG
jgi:hypothetical protein